MDAEIANFDEEIASLKKAAQDAPKGQRASPLDLTEGERRLQELKTNRDKLNRFTTDLNKALQEANSPEKQQLRSQVAQAQLARLGTVAVVSRGCSPPAKPYSNRS